MNTVNFFTACFNNFKGDPFNASKKNKISSLKINIIIDNTAKIKKNNNFNFLNSEGDFKRGNKREKKFYNKKNDDKSGKIWIIKLNKYYKERKKFKFKNF